MGLLDKLLGKKTPTPEPAAEEHAPEQTAPRSDAWDAAAHQCTAADLRAALAAGEGADAPMLLDVREMWEYNAGHIDGAINIPLSELGIMVRDLEPERSYVTICAHGMRSLDAAYLLSSHGFESVKSLQGGMAAWDSSAG